MSNRPFRHPPYVRSTQRQLPVNCELVSSGLASSRPGVLEGDPSCREPCFRQE
jgi:hypothetical protein